MFILLFLLVLTLVNRSFSTRSYLCLFYHILHSTPRIKHKVRVCVRSVRLKLQIESLERRHIDPISKPSKLWMANQLHLRWSFSQLGIQPKAL